MHNVYSQLASLFGFHAFRPHQENVVRAVLDGRDTFTVMPTGGGKSLCYQLPAKLLPGVCVVVSPLISLMKDQVDAALATGLAASAYNSASSAREKNLARTKLLNSTLDLLYISPERLRLHDFLEFLKTVPISFFAIDEAHCISEWGHDFRPDYLALSSLAAEFPGVPIAAFTATATSRVAKDIMERLRLRNPLVTQASFNRPNLFYQVTPKGDLHKQLLAFLRVHMDESGIIYRTTRKNVDATAAFLTGHGVNARTYHAGLSDKERAETQDAFRNDACRIIVATIAFGMGIDKSNVRYVVHADLPKNIEGYYQETGRAGRDGEPARCVLFYGRGDVAQLMRFAESIDDAQAREASRQQLYRMLEFTQRDGCRRKALLHYFGEEYPENNCGGCDICTGEVEREDATVNVQKLLSAMVRTNCRFGAQHCINIVMGKDTNRILALDHDQLPTFGVGKDRDATYWHSVMDAIMVQGLASIADPMLPVPVITNAGWIVLRGQQRCSIVKQAEKPAKTKRSPKIQPGAERNLETLASPLFAALREERARIAGERGVPPYVIFPDNTLREMAQTLPDSPKRMLELTGVGTHKLAAFGDQILSLIAVYRKEHPEEATAADIRQNTPPPAEHKPRQPARKHKKQPVRAPQKPSTASRTRHTRPLPENRPISDTVRETELLLDTGHSVTAIAAMRALKPATILQHMETLAATGKPFSPEAHMTPSRLAVFRTLFVAAGSWKLALVIELAKSAKPPLALSFEDARLACILLRASGFDPSCKKK